MHVYAWLAKLTGGIQLLVVISYFVWREWSNYTKLNLMRIVATTSYEAKKAEDAHGGQ